MSSAPFTYRLVEISVPDRSEPVCWFAYFFGGTLLSGHLFLDDFLLDGLDGFCLAVLEDVIGQVETVTLVHKI